MILAEPKTAIERLLTPLEDCLTLDTAQQIMTLRADADLQTEVDRLADKANAGSLTDDERTRYEEIIHFSQFVTLLQLRAREMVEATSAA